MHVTFYHDSIVPPQKYGGTERVIAWLIRALLKLGHTTTLIARPGSDVPGSEFIPIPPNSGGAWLSLIPKATDLVHLWGTPSTLPTQPFIVTIEGNGQPGESFHRNTVFVSEKHAANHGSQNYVYNGIDPDDFSCDPIRENYLVFLAKASWKVKNLRGAVEIARKSGLELVVMGSKDWPLQLQRRIPPSLRGGVKYMGMVGDIEKRQILRKARALLFPVRWPEPFGLALTEALASGCPVFGTPYGSLPEIVSPDVGILSADANTLVEGIANQRFSPETCRQRVLKGFTHLQMAQKYLDYYGQVLKNGTLLHSEKNPQSFLSMPADTLLPWTFVR